MQTNDQSLINLEIDEMKRIGELLGFPVSLSETFSSGKKVDDNYRELFTKQLFEHISKAALKRHNEEREAYIIHLEQKYKEELAELERRHEAEYAEVLAKVEESVL